MHRQLKMGGKKAVELYGNSPEIKRQEVQSNAWEENLKIFHFRHLLTFLWFFCQFFRFFSFLAPMHFSARLCQISPQKCILTTLMSYGSILDVSHFDHRSPNLWRSPIFEWKNIFLRFDQSPLWHPVIWLNFNKL